MHSIRCLFVLFAICPALNAATYHVSASRGDDARSATQAQQAAMPWRTLGRAAEAMQPGDVCVMASGVYREMVTPSADGVTFRAAEGAVVTVSGCDVVTGWERHRGDVWKAKMSAEVREVFEGEAMMRPARFPDEDGDPFSTGEWAETSFSEVTREGTGVAAVTFAGRDWPAGHWTGAYYSGLHGGNAYQPNFGRIAGSTSGTLRLTALSGAVLTNPREFGGDGRGYIIRHLNALDAPREWHWQDGALFFQSSDATPPAQKEVQARVRLWGFDLSGRRGVRLEGLRFFASSVLMDGATEC